MSPSGQQHACEVLIVGAGPAGSAAAMWLARKGHDVLLVDRHAFPRDKICGDALIPDALRTLDRLGLAERVRALARPACGIDVHPPSGAPVRICGDVACLPRRVLDAMLRDAAGLTGARLLAPVTLRELSRRDGRVVGAIGTAADAAAVAIRARFVVLATGANAAALEGAGACLRKAPSGVAVRAYYRNPALAEGMDALVISFHRALCPGYGWIFPGPDGVLNVGAGVFTDGAHGRAHVNVRRVFDAFASAFPLAARAIATSEPLGGVKGAPLRTALTGAAFAAPGLLVVGEAAGATYSFSGEGIGKAMETALTAAEIVASCLGGELDHAEVPRAYEAALRARFGARFETYERAQAWLAHPWLCNALAVRARSSSHLRARLEAMLAEREDASGVFSWSGLARALLPG